MRYVIMMCAALLLGACVGTNGSSVPVTNHYSYAAENGIADDTPCCAAVERPAFMDRVAVSSTDAALKREAESVAEDGGMHLVPVPSSHLLFRLAKGENVNGPCVKISAQYNGRIVQEDSLPYGDENLFRMGMRDFMNRSARMAHTADLVAAKH